MMLITVVSSFLMWMAAVAYLDLVDSSRSCVCTVDRHKFADCTDLHLYTVPQCLPEDIAYLTLSNNNITSLQNGFFTRFKSLTAIIIDQNDLETMAADTFRGNGEIISLTFAYNNLKEIPPRLFSYVPKLAYLNLDYNKISVLDKDLFASNKQLYSLSLSGNKITTLDATLLRFLSLDSLKVDENDVDFLDGDLLASSRGLRTLDAKSMKLRLESLKILDSLENLEYLDVSLNGILFSDSYTFDKNRKLTTIRLSGNDLSAATTGMMFRNLEELGTLDLSNCSLRRLDKDSFVDNEDLAFLFLSDNELSSLDRGVFRNNVNLWRLDLSNNKLTAIPLGLLDNLSSLEVLDLTRNDLNIISPQMFEKTTGLYYLTLQENPVTCNCQLKAFLIFAKERGLNLALPQLSCASPLALSGFAAVDVMDLFNCKTQF